jgi:Flp pilus assembly protein TadD
MNRWQEAADDFERVTKLAPDFAPAWCALGRSLRFLGRKKRAREALSRCRAVGAGTSMQQDADKQLEELQ